jgi:hypothetical protein
LERAQVDAEAFAALVQEILSFDKTLVTEFTQV